MATFIPGIRCAISGRAIGSANEAVAFPPFIANEADPLHVFSDAVVHADVFRTHPLAAETQARLDEARRQTEPRNRRCLICGQLITDPDDYLGLGYLVADRMHPLHRFNYAHFHRSCLAKWPETNDLIAALDSFDTSGAWKGDGLKRLMNALRLVAS